MAMTKERQEYISKRNALKRHMEIVRPEMFYCASCSGTSAQVNKIREEESFSGSNVMVNVFAVVCPSCESTGYHCGYQLIARTKKENDHLAQNKAIEMWKEINGD